MSTLRMRRILLLITDLEIGGTPTVVRELAVRLHAPPDVHVEVACLSVSGPVADQIREAGVDVMGLGARGVGDLPAIVWRFVQLVREHRIDTVFSFLVHANLVAAIGSIFLRDVRFLQSIQTTQPTPPWHWKVQAIAQELADKIVVPSESVARVAGEWSSVPRDKVVVIPNAVDVEAPCSTGFQPVQRSATGEIRVGFLGRLDPVKRVPDLMDAIVDLDDAFELHIYGEGPVRRGLELMILQFGFEDRITLHGRTVSPQAAIRSMDVLVLPSEAEGFGLVLIEAMAAGVPVVATDVPGIRDVVRNGETGLLVPVARPDLLAQAIRRVTEDDALREKLVQNAFEAVQKRFSWAAVLQRYREVLKLPEP
jgi:glycosyltransferase involved in cell wall biosynthesis